MDIRKISVGSDYKSAMHYVVGQRVLGGSYAIHLIKFYEDFQEFKIWIIDDEGVILCWKYFNHNVPISVELNINL